MVVTPPMTPKMMPVAVFGCGVQRSKRAGEPVPQHEQRGDQADREPDVRGRQRGRHQPGDAMPTIMLGSMSFRFQALQLRR